MSVNQILDMLLTLGGSHAFIRVAWITYAAIMLYAVCQEAASILIGAIGGFVWWSTLRNVRATIHVPALVRKWPQVVLVLAAWWVSAMLLRFALDCIFGKTNMKGTKDLRILLFFLLARVTLQCALRLVKWDTLCAPFFSKLDNERMFWWLMLVRFIHGTSSMLIATSLLSYLCLIPFTFYVLCPRWIAVVTIVDAAFESLYRSLQMQQVLRKVAALEAAQAPQQQQEASQSEATNQDVLTDAAQAPQQQQEAIQPEAGGQIVPANDRVPRPVSNPLFTLWGRNVYTILFNTNFQADVFYPSGTNQPDIPPDEVPGFIRSLCDSESDDDNAVSPSEIAVDTVKPKKNNKREREGAPATVSWVTPDDTDAPEWFRRTKARQEQNALKKRRSKRKRDIAQD